MQEWIYNNLFILLCSFCHGVEIGFQAIHQEKVGQAVSEDQKREELAFALERCWSWLLVMLRHVAEQPVKKKKHRSEVQ